MRLFRSAGPRTLEAAILLACAGLFAAAPAVLAAGAGGPAAIPSAGLVSGASATAPAISPSSGRALVCGAPPVGVAEAQAVQAVLDRWAFENAPGLSDGVIRIAAHVITAGGAGAVTDEQLAAMARTLNRGFAGTGFRFVLATVDRTEAPGWFLMSPESAPERDAQEALAIEPARRLNVYVCDAAGVADGWARYPWSAPEGSTQHGVVLDYRALQEEEQADGAESVAAHLVGHYLGLLETEGPRDARDRPGAGDVARIRAIMSIYRPSLCSDRGERTTAASEIVPSAGAEPEGGRVLSYRGAYPNPFRAETALRFTLPRSQPVILRVYSVTGQLVRTLIDAPLPPGDHSAIFRAGALPSGAYFAVLRAGSVQMSRTILLVR